MTNFIGLTREVELRNGTKVTVRSIPPWLSDRAQGRVPLPRPPMKEIESQVPGGGTQKFLDEQDPEYIQSLADAQTERMRLATEFFWAYGVTGVDPPPEDDWKEEIERWIPDIEWRKGAMGRRLDYIQYVLVASQADMLTLQNAIIELSGPTEEQVRLMEESFRGEVPELHDLQLPAPGR